MTLTRREFLASAAAATLGCAGASRAARSGAGAALDTLRVERPVFTVAGLEPAHDGLRVAQLSDLHCGARTPPERIVGAIARANALAPDLVVLTGDYVCRDRSCVGLMRELLGGLRAPTVAVLGNHDHWVDPDGATRALASHGYAVLLNQSTTLSLRGAPFTVIGVGDHLTGNSRPREALAGARRGSRLVLAHGPRTADQLATLGEPLLCLSGHTHGGQVNLPVLTPLMMRAVAREPYARGAFRLGPVQLYVNRGVGNSALRVRINSDPEVTLATLRARA